MQAVLPAVHTGSAQRGQEDEGGLCMSRTRCTGVEGRSHRGYLSDALGSGPVGGQQVECTAGWGGGAGGWRGRQDLFSNLQLLLVWAGVGCSGEGGVRGGAGALMLGRFGCS